MGFAINAGSAAIMGTLTDSGITLSKKMCHFAYCQFAGSSYFMLGHHNGCRKAQVIRNLAVAINLGLLESGVQYINLSMYGSMQLWQIPLTY